MNFTDVLKTPENIDEIKKEYEKHYLLYYTPKEEFLNSITHLAGLLFGLIGTYFLIAESNSEIKIITSALLTICFCALYLASFLYHSITNLKAKSFLRKIDYSFVNLMVISCGLSASLVYKTKIGYIMLGISLFTSVLMCILCLINFKKFRQITVCSNVFTGLLMSIPIITQKDLIPKTSLDLYIAGVVTILIGFTLFGRKWRYIHALFHTFILIGTILIYFSNYFIIKLT